jgi:putative membrane protein
MSPHQNTRLSTLSISVGLSLLVAAAGAAAQGAGTPSAAGMKATAGTSVAAADKTFVEKAAGGGMAEVELGKLATQKASSDQVKQFGSRMVNDHSKTNDELKQIATAKGMTLPTDLDAKHKSEMAKLQKLSGAQFDRAYMDAMVQDHKETVALFRTQSTSGKDGELKGFAAKTLPHLEEHLKMAQATDSAVKGAKSASR